MEFAGDFAAFPDTRGQIHLSEGTDGALKVALCGDLRDWGIEDRIAEQVGDRQIVSLDFAEAGRITPEAAIALTQLAGAGFQGARAGGGLGFQPITGLRYL